MIGKGIRSNECIVKDKRGYYIDAALTGKKRVIKHVAKIGITFYRSIYFALKIVKTVKLLVKLLSNCNRNFRGQSSV